MLTLALESASYGIINIFVATLFDEARKLSVTHSVELNPMVGKV